MSSGAFALYIDLTAGSGGGGGGGMGGDKAPIHRVIPLPHTNRDGIHFNHRRLTLAYDNLGGGPDPLPVGIRFIDNNHMIIPPGLQPQPIRIGCTEVPIPPEACLASFEVLPLKPEPGPRGSLTALVEYDS
jgi:hypothetical protein